MGASGVSLNLLTVVSPLKQMRFLSYWNILSVIDYSINAMELSVVLIYKTNEL